MSFDHAALPPDFQYGPTPPRRKSKLLWILLLAIPLGMVAVIVFVVGIGALYVFTATEEEVTAEDRRLVVDIQTLAGSLEDFVPDPNNETITKQRYFDRSYEIEYEYIDPDDDYEPYLYCCVTVERKHSDALTSYVAVWQASKLGLRWGADAEVKIVERNELFRWGDQSRFAIVMVDGEPGGNLFVARKGKVVVGVMLGGVYFDEAEGFSGFASPALSSIENLRP
ncbi:MAG: hypothetical protein ACYSWU_07675 [Planctomycetota bacterium]|jgi:hypothetical protein